MFITNFSRLATTPARSLALEVVEAALRVLSPKLLLQQRLRIRNDVLYIGKKRFPLQRQRVVVLGAGKAAAAMAAAVEETLGLASITGGVVITTAEDTAARPQKVRVVQGDHPLPSRSSLVATQMILELTKAVGPKDLVLWLISGGASALLAAPTPGIGLEEKRATTAALLRCGATIDEMNTVRKHLSLVKGGWLAQRLYPATVITLALSDVVSGRIDTLGSGPTQPDPTTYADALAVMDRYDLRRRVPSAVLEHLQAGAAGALPETPKAGDPCFQGSLTCIIGSPSSAAAAAARAAQAAGQRTEVLTDQLTGEARAVAGVLGAMLRYRAAARPRGPLVVVAAGETTVTVTGNGRGGRCQELAAALIPEIAGLDGCAVACVATDGQDFIEGVGGALVDGETAGQGATEGLRVEDYLQANDSYSLHSRLGTTLEMSPTGTNVCDLIVAVLGCS